MLAPLTDIEESKGIFDIETQAHIFLEKLIHTEGRKNTPMLTFT